jgi:hypothetical protein
MGELYLVLDVFEEITFNAAYGGSKLGNSRIICDAAFGGRNITNDINSSNITTLQHYNIAN